jgi:hypothetical protein
VSPIDKYPYGKAPFVVLVIAIVGAGMRRGDRASHDERLDPSCAARTR